MANVFGSDSAETINALDGVTNGADTIFGFGGNDTIFGLGGNDLIIGGSGADAINGGSGTDTASYSDSTEAVVVGLITNQGFGGTAEGDTLTSIENLTGSSFGDFLVGNDGANVLAGLEGSDTLMGGLGADTLFGDSGNDTLKGGGGADTLNGGSGVDTASYVESGAAVFISLFNDVAAYGDAEGDELNSIENVTGSVHADDLWGNDGTNVLNGNDGNDTLKGFGGADTLFGGDDHDNLFGMDGNDVLNGGNGNDELEGAAGVDTLTGGLGADTFIWAAAEGGFVSLDMIDKIMDFNPAQGDLIDVQGIDANSTAGGNQAFSFVGDYTGNGGFTAAGQVAFTYSGGNTYLLFNTDNVFVDSGGNAESEHIIRIEGVVTPEASWFLL